MPLANSKMEQHPFLQEMYADDYFPNGLVRQIETILRNLCARIEADKPAELAARYVLAAAATEQINDLEEAFEEAGSEIETAAREAICDEFPTIARAYGYHDADSEELTAAREC